tara:strand:+ start:1158 stop:1754 length:597 start_codon:yes stop_codon:yes gene_type:complete
METTTVATTAVVDNFMSFGEETATIQERIAQDVNGKNKYFFLRMSSDYAVKKMEGQIIVEEANEGTHIKVSENWQPTIQEATDYLVSQTGERSAFEALKKELRPVEDSPKFAQAWIEATKDDEYKTRAQKGCMNVEGKTLFVYVVASVFITGRRKITTPSMVLITEREFNGLSASKRVTEILLERSAYANTQNELASI